MGTVPVSWQTGTELALHAALDGSTQRAQLWPVFKAFAILVRTTYLLTALLVLAWAASTLVSFTQSLFRPADFGRNLWDVYEAILLIVLCVLPLRALERLLVRATFVPDSRIRERPVVATIVVITSVLGWALALLAGWVMARKLPDADIGGPLGGAMTLALMLFAVALLTGELVLVGRAARQST